MDTNSELKDILLNSEDDKGGKASKKTLLSLAAVIILFLSVVAVMKMLNSQPEDQNEVDSRLILPPAPNEQSNEQSTKVADKNDDQLFEQVPIVPENKSQDDFDNMVKKLKEKENPSESGAAGNEVANQAKPEIVPDEKATKIEMGASSNDEPKKQIVKKVENKEPVAKKAETPKTTKKAEKAEAPKTTKKAETKPEKTAKATPKDKTNKADSQKTVSNDITTGKNAIYVQVASIAKSKPDASLVSKISARGYKYSVINAKGAYKVILGPFSDDKIKSTIADIRKNISSGAFVYRAK
ncbi:MAG: SPOR domain-containing protein [Campylobacter sp.]|nr:SPOR domain-containing protein [Campylobacter sp.]